MHKTVLVLIPLLALLHLATPPLPAQGTAGEGTAEETAVSRHHQRLQELEREIRFRLLRATHAAERIAGAGLDADAERFHRRLEALATEIHRLDAEAARPLVGKLRALRALVANLELAIERAEAPHLPSSFLVEDVHRSAVGEDGAPANDRCADATPIGVGTVVGSTGGATNDGQASCGGSFFSPDVWFRFQAPSTGNYSADTFGSDYDTVLSVHDGGCPGTTSNQEACNDDVYGLGSAVGFYASAGEEFWIRVSGFDGATGSFQLTVGTRAEISGRVRDVDTGSPLTDGWIRAYDGDGYSMGSWFVDGIGSYAGTGLDAGPYFLRTNYFDGYLDELYDDLPCPNGVCDPTTGTPVVVGSGDTVGGVNFDLGPGGSIAGTVTESATGDPVADLRVEVYDATGDYVTDLYTDSAGDYEAVGLSGSYFVVAESSDYLNEIYDDVPCPGGAPYSCDVTAGELVEVTAGATTSGIDFQLDRHGTITGTVTDSGTGDPLGSVWVEVRTESGSYVGSYGYTGADGDYRIGGLEAGSYLLTAEEYGYVDQLYDGISCPDDIYSCDLDLGTPVAVDVNVTASGVDFQLDRLGAVTGTVTDAAGDPVPYARVEVWDGAGDFVRDDYTDGVGEYRIERLRPGSHFVGTDTDSELLDELYDDLPCPGGLAVGCDPTTGDPVLVAINTTNSGVDFQLALGGSISGRITDGVTGDPISSREVEIRDVTGSLVHSASSDGDGNFTVGGLDTGTYFAVTSSSYYYEPYLDELYDDLPCPGGSCDATTGTPIPVTLGSDTGGVDFGLDRLGTITGTVTASATGDPLSLRVELYDESGSYRDSDYADGSGHYEFAGLAPGNYFVATDSYSFDGYRNEVYDGVPCDGFCNVTSGTPVAAALNTITEGIDFQLERLGSITGTVTDAETGLPISAEITVWDAEGVSQHYDYAYSGQYEINGLAPGTYYVVASGDYGTSYLDELYDDVPCPGGGGQGCDPTKGTPIEVTLDGTAVADFALQTFDYGIVGTVFDDWTGTRLGGVSVDAWDADGNLVERATTRADGLFILPLDPGSYYLSTDNDHGYVEEVYDGVTCPFGSVYDGLCNLAAGTPVAVGSAFGGPPIAAGMNFALEPVGVLFRDGFESGDLSGWSGTVGAAP